MKLIQTKKRGLSRIFSAFINTGKGLTWLTRHEAAFKQELVLTLVLIVISCSLNISLLQQIALISALLFVLFAEIINTAIEVIIDRISLNQHPLSGLAKDLGSAAVFISLVIAGLIWGGILWML